MIQIRHNVFETNSSSVHSLTFCMGSEFDKWVKGETYFYNSTYKLPEGRSQFFTWADMIEFLKDNFQFYSDNEKMLLEYKENDEEGFYEELRHWNFYTDASFDFFNDCDGTETFSQSYTTPRGERVVAFGYSGSRY